MDYPDTESTDNLILGLGNVTATQEAFAALDDGALLEDVLSRHVNQEYGDVSFEQKFQNDLAFHKQQGEVISRFPLSSGVTITVITRWNQPLTAIAIEKTEEP